jgi:iron complex transport system ATP-binding protein
MESLLEARNISAWRGRREVLRGVSLLVRRGEALALVGPNAAGKSTLVRALAGLLRVRQGEVRLKGRPLHLWPRQTVARAIALVMPEEEGAEALAVEDRVALGRFPHCGPFRPHGIQDRTAVAHALEQAGITHLARRRLGTLSAGERQLAALARGLAQEPELLLLDEPAAHLDIGHQLRLFRVLDEVRDRGVAVVAVVHDLQRAAAWASRMLLIADGRLAAEGPPDSVLGSAAAAEAFEVQILGHRVDGAPHPLYRFLEKTPPP